MNTGGQIVGGIEAVTLSDEEARRRGTQKTVLERRAPPTFDVLIEIQHRERFAVHLDIMSAVDALLRDVPMPPEIRTRDEAGQIQIEKLAPPKPAAKADVKVPRRGRGTVDQTTGRPAPVIQEQTQRSDSINPPAINTPSVGAKLQTRYVQQFHPTLYSGARRAGAD